MCEVCSTCIPFGANKLQLPASVGDYSFGWGSVFVVILKVTHAHTCDLLLQLASASKDTSHGFSKFALYFIHTNTTILLVHYHITYCVNIFCKHFTKRNSSRFKTSHKNKKYKNKNN